MLSDTIIRKSKPKKKPYKIADSGGLYLIVFPTGGRSFRWDYRYDGRRKTLTFGLYPAVGLAQAREWTATARKQLAEGLDPAVQRKIEKASAFLDNACTFEVVSREWVEAHLSEKSQSHRERSIALLKNDLMPILGGIPMRDLNAVLLLGALRRIEARSVDMANRARSMAGQILRYAVATGRAERDFTPDLRGALRKHQGSHYDAIVDPLMFAELMLLIDQYEGSMTVRNALKIAPLLMLRPGELRHMTWEHVNWELQQLEFPAGFMKDKSRSHVVPLSRQAVSILEEQYRYCGAFSYAFPSAHGRRKHMGPTAMQKALKTLVPLGIQQSVHGFRASARTIMEEVLNVPPHLLEHQLHHMVRDPNRRAYNRTVHLNARREMLQNWADWLDTQKAEIANRMQREKQQHGASSSATKDGQSQLEIFFEET
ncbi:tyrosine-type recombinase/integrase [Microbulbifer elongatus]|uniref:tyrosine-type recombinase/integrase n=1 Tax=Microbulbifer elongatus TaxID=86173 RepID=UPI001CFEB785|nr:integrase arm-type DNA-binding domain-containing protein [Microbulbifer elongatus]